ncbi:MAG: DUF5697 family protein [Clostridiales bacterium]|nr:DUF5697 family protein [Clostridiales bacterium]
MAVEVLSITGEQMQVEPENLQNGRAEDKAAEDNRAALLMETEQTICRMVRSIGMLTKGQLWEYFKETVSQENVSRLLRNLAKAGQVYMLPEDGLKDSAQEHYVPDSRISDPAYYKVAGNTYASMEKYRKHMESLGNRCQAFWLYLMFREAGNAGFPVAVESSDFPFIILAFSMMDEIYEVFYIKKGREADLAPLQANERYLSQGERDALRRIVMVDDAGQIQDILKFHIQGVRCFAAIKGGGEFDLKMLDAKKT